MNFSEQSVAAFLEDVAAKQPVPGGGAVVGVVGALAAALGEMVLNYTAGKKRFREHEDELRLALRQLAGYRDLLLELSEQDAAAYELLSSLLKLDKDDPKRQAEMPAAVVAAIRVPQACVACCSDLLRLLDSLLGKTNRNLRSDLVVAAILAFAGARSAEWNVRINLPFLEDEMDRERVQRETLETLGHAADFAANIERSCE
jgi:methenyltetrahydrofolate cyclohydrolase